MHRKGLAPIVILLVVAGLYYLYPRLQPVPLGSSSIPLANTTSSASPRPTTSPTPAPIGSSKNGLLGNDPTFFPITIWDQAPSTASSYRNIGINLFTGVPGGATDLPGLHSAGMSSIPAIGSLSADLPSLYQSDIKGWYQPDEPDDAQRNSTTNTWGPCKDPSILVNSYNNAKAVDSARPIIINFGRHAANTSFRDSGSCGLIDPAVLYSNYAQGSDIVSFDDYPVTNHTQITEVADGVDHLKAWGGGRPVWAFLETEQQDTGLGRPTPAQVKVEVWLALTHGAVGIQYYAHAFLGKPQENDAALLSDSVMSAAVGAINAEITRLAPILNSPTITNGATVAASARIDEIVKQYKGATYLFAVNPTGGSVSATFTVSGLNNRSVTVIDESRPLTMTSSSFQDTFPAYSVHLYEIR
jgi:hypothetical protein